MNDARKNDIITKMEPVKAGSVRVAFELPDYLWADQVFVVGDFNDEPKVAPDTAGSEWTWRLEIDLSGGRSYQFRYWVDGRWLTDQHADKVVIDSLQLHSSL